MKDDHDTLLISFVVHLELNVSDNNKREMGQ